MPEASSARDPQPGTAQGLKPYQPPTLRELGTVAELTGTTPINELVNDTSGAVYTTS